MEASYKNIERANSHEYESLYEYIWRRVWRSLYECMAQFSVGDSMYESVSYMGDLVEPKRTTIRVVCRCQESSAYPAITTITPSVNYRPPNDGLHTSFSAQLYENNAVCWPLYTAPNSFCELLCTVIVFTDGVCAL